MIAFIADLHLGVKLKNKDFMDSLNLFYQHIKEQNEPCTDIFVCGDLFDHRLTIDEHKFASVFLLNLVCNHMNQHGGNAAVHFVHGTYNHDYEQYQIYMPILEKLNGVLVDYIDEACEATLLDGRKVLYLPQQYGKVPSYETLLSREKHYDLIVGHGPISSSTKAPCRSAGNEIMHSVELLSDISDLCVFGHYHDYTDFNSHVYYAGTWLRWQYGQDEECVFLFAKDDNSIIKIKNPIALEYKTISIHNPEELRMELSNEIKTPHRYIFTPDTEQDMNEYMSIMSIHSNNSNIKWIMNTKEEEQIEEAISNNEDIVNTTMNSGIEPISSLISYIDEKYNIDTTDEIHAYESKINKEEN